MTFHLECEGIGEVTAFIKDETYENILFALNFLAAAASVSVKIRILFLS